MKDFKRPALFLVFCAVLLSSVSLLIVRAQTTATVSLDRNLYSVGAVMTIRGTGFTPGAYIYVSVERPDHVIDAVSPNPLADANGAFTATYTPPLIPGRYKVSATDGTSTTTAAATEADAVSYDKNGYVKKSIVPEDQTGNWSTGNQGQFYAENQWTFDEYEISGISAPGDVPSFDVFFNHYESSSNAVFVDALANFRACLDCGTADGSLTSGPHAGMLSDSNPLPPPGDTTGWVVVPIPGSVITHINRPLNSASNGSGTMVTSGQSGFCSSDATETNPDGITTFPAEFHCFHVDGASLAALFSGKIVGSGTHTITLSFNGHLAASFVWGNGTTGVGGHEASVGDCTSIYYAHPYTASSLTEASSFEPQTAHGCDTTGGPIPIYGTDDYAGWTHVFHGVGFASGSSRHWSMANQTSGPNGAIEIPIPTVQAPSNTIVIVKRTVPSNATATFNFTGDLGAFSLSSPFPSQGTFTNIAAGVGYQVTENALSGWTLTGLSCAVTSGKDDGSGSWPLGGPNPSPTATITLGGTDSGVTLTCTYTNAGEGHIVVVKNTQPSPNPFDANFHFTTSGSGYTSFSLKDSASNGGVTNTDGGSAPAGGLVPGTYTVSEDPLSNWILASRTCALTTTGSGTSTFPASLPAGPTQPNSASITLGAGDTVTCTYTNDWPDAQVLISPLNPVNPVGSPETFTITVNAIPDGATPVAFTSITPSVTPTAGLTQNTNTCASPVISNGGNTATCTLTINSSTSGQYTAHVVAVVTIAGVAITRATGDGLGLTGLKDSADAVKTYADARIALTPGSATNGITQPHTITATVTQNIGAGFVPAPDSTTVNFTLTNSGGATASFVGGVNTCNTAGGTGTCTVQINSPTAGSVSIHGTTTFNVDGVPLTRSTGDGLSGDSADAQKTYVASHLIVVKHTQPSPNPFDANFHFTTTGGTGAGAYTGFNLKDTQSNTDGGGTPAAGLAPGDYTIGEDALSEGAEGSWILASRTCALTVSGSGTSTFPASLPAGPSQPNSASIHLGIGDTVTCTYTNDWPDAFVSITPLNPVNEVGNAETFNISVTAVPDGLTPVAFTSITPSITSSPQPSSSSTTCGSPSIVTNGDGTQTASCTYTINSTTVNTYTAHVHAVVTINGVAITRDTGDGLGFPTTDSANAVKTYVDANITIGPATAKNEINQQHTFNIVVTAVPDGTTPSFGTVTTSVVPTPSTLGTVSCSAPVGNVENCSLAINNNAAGVFTANACADVTMGGVTVHRCTNDAHAGDVGPAVKTYISATTALTFVSQVPSGTVQAGTPVTITVNEANTGTSDLSAVTVTGSPCATWVGPTSLASGTNANFTCTFNAAVGTNSWTADGHGTDSLGNPESTNNEHQQGSFSGVLSTLIVVKNTVGGNGTFNFTGSGDGVAASFPITTSGNTGHATFAGIAAGPKSVTETVPAGWLGNTTNVSCSETVPGVTSSSVGTLTTGTVAATGTITANVSLGIGATVTCTFTNALLPTLNIVKNATALGGPFNFIVTGPSAENPSLSVTSGTSAQEGVHSISIGDYTFAEDQATMPPGFTMTDLSCSTGAGSQLNNNGIPTLWSFTAHYGDAIVCEATNSNVKTTRTQGFWATHTTLADNVWNGTVDLTLLPGFTPLGADNTLCGVTITAISTYPPNPGANELMGGFWSNISKTSTNGKRSAIDQARMQMLQQYLAAVLNVHAFGSGSEGMLTTAQNAYCGTDLSAIKAQVGILGTFNQSGDNLAFTPGASATAQESKKEADIPFWDTPSTPHN